jgi:hypothetical protein
MSISTAAYRLKAVNDFDDARRWLVWDKLYATFLRRDPYLLSFEEVRPFLGTKLYGGLQEIPVNAIVGSVNRPHDFNRRFQPLRDSSANRWVQMHVLASEQGWPPIEVHKVGNLYFVEDGHHRVSVARHLGLKLMEATVWDYNVAATFSPNITPAKLVARLQAMSTKGQVIVPEVCVCS